MTEEPEIYDDNDTVFGDWCGAVPWKMKRWTEQKLQVAHVQGGEKVVRFVESELYRRRNIELQNHIKALTGATESVRQATLAVDTGISMLSQSSASLENLTRRLIKATKGVHTEIQILSASSDRLEGLTVKLKNLTWVLIWLTILAVIVPVGVEVWHAIREVDAPTQPIVVQHVLPTAPRTPPLPAP